MSELLIKLDVLKNLLDRYFLELTEQEFNTLLEIIDQIKDEIIENVKKEYNHTTH